MSVASLRVLDMKDPFLGVQSPGVVGSFGAQAPQVGDGFGVLAKLVLE